MKKLVYGVMCWIRMSVECVVADMLVASLSVAYGAIVRIQIHAAGAESLEAGFNSMLGEGMAYCSEIAKHGEFIT